MDVGDALIDRVDQDLLDVLDDRRVLDLGAFLVERDNAAFLEVELQVLHRGHLAQRRALRLDELGNGLRELVVLDHHRFDDEVRLEPDLLERLEVGGIRGRDVETVAALVQRQNPPRLRHLEIDQLLVDLIEIERGQVHQRHAERARAEGGDLRRGHPLALEELLDEGDARLLGLRLDRLGVVFRHQAVLRQRAREPAQIASRGGLGGHGRAWVARSAAECRAVGMLKQFTCLWLARRSPRVIPTA